MKKNIRLLKNIVSAIGIYSILLLVNLWVSKIFLKTYGSEANGLISSINQIFSYISLFEAGIGTATISALYMPISKNDDIGTNEVLSASQRYYRMATIGYGACVIIMSFIWPFLLNTNISFFTIWALIFFQGVSGVITFAFISTIINYFIASGKNYINNYVHILITIITYIVKLVICYSGASIVLISVSSIIINILKCVLYILLIKKYFPHFKISKSTNMPVLKQKNAFLIHEISGVIFASTDTIVISLFCGLTEASVYTVYSLVTNAINSVMGQALNGSYYILGNSYSKDKKEYKIIHDVFNSIYICIIFSVFTTVYLLFKPFISLYTSGIKDANYIDSVLPILFILIQLLSVCRMVDNYLIKIALHAKQTINRTIIESGINIVVSLVLVNFIGIYGVLCGTICALLYRTNDIIWYANRKLLNRYPWKEYKIYIFNFALFGTFVLLNEILSITIHSYLQLIAYAVFIFIAVIFIFFIVNMTINYRDFKKLLSKIKNKSHS